MAAIAHHGNVISLADVRAERRAAPQISLDMDWKQPDAEEPWAPCRTVWFALTISAGLWAIILGVLLFV